MLHIFSLLFFSFRSTHNYFYYYLNILMFYKHDTRSIFWKMFWAVNGILIGRNCFYIKTVNVRHNTIVYVHSLIVHCHLFSFQTQITGFDEIIFFTCFFFTHSESLARGATAKRLIWCGRFISKTPMSGGRALNRPRPSSSNSQWRESSASSKRTRGRTTSFYFQS